MSDIILPQSIFWFHHGSVEESNNFPPKQAVVTSDANETFNDDTTIVDMKPVPKEEKGVELETVSTETLYKPVEKEVRLDNTKLSKAEPEAAAEEELLKIERSENSSSSKSGSSKDKEKSKDSNRDRNTYFPAEKEISLKNRQLSKEEPEATAKNETLKDEKRKSSSSSESRNSADKKESRKRNRNESQDEGKDRQKDGNIEKYRKSKSCSFSKHRSSSSVDEKGRHGRDMRKSNASSSSSKQKSENLSLQLQTAPIKRPSPPGDISDSIKPPGKKLKMDNTDIPERLPPKLSAVFLRESSLFMDTIIAAATKKQTKKRQRTPVVSKEKSEIDVEGKRKEASSAIPADESSEKAELDTEKIGGELKGILLNAKKKGPKRSITWKNDAELVEIRYFEKSPKDPNILNPCPKHPTISNMTPSNKQRHLNMFPQNSISDGFGQISGKLLGVDIMKAQIMWRVPTIIEQNDPLVKPGCGSLEKDIQLAREKSVLQTLYFKKCEIPYSPEEPIQEHHVLSDLVHIPLEDPERPVLDFSSTPWPETKGMAPVDEHPKSIQPPIQ